MHPYTEVASQMTLTVQQCAIQLGVVSGTICKWIRAGQIRAETIRRGRVQWTYLIQVEDWQRFVAERTEGRLLDRRTVQAELQREPDAARPYHGTAYFVSDDPNDRAVKQAALMQKALRGCRASREALRQSPFHLTYWMAVDGPR